MKSIIDYAKYYKDFTFEEIHFNQMDALVYSILVYLPIHKNSNGSTISELINYIGLEKAKGAVGPIAGELLPIILQSKRFKNVKVYDFVKREDEEVQFGAVTFRSSANTFVTFEGTNSSIVGWVENFLLTSEYPTKTQELAIEYLNRVINDSDSNVIVGGHSKGGNLAMAASMECKNDIFNKIEKIYNFDGPGFRKQEFESDKFKKMNAKTNNILPEGSLIGILMYNKNYNFIEADGIGLKEHYPTSWNVFGEFFEPAKQSRSSKHLQDRICKSVEELKEEDVKNLLAAVLNFFARNNINSSNDFKNIKLNEYRALAKEIKDVDEKTKQLFFDVTRILFNPDSNKEEIKKKRFFG